MKELGHVLQVFRTLLLKGPQNGLKYFKPSNCRKEATIFIKTIAY